MRKLRLFVTPLTCGLLLGLFLFTTGAFAQSSHGNTPAHAVTSAGMVRPPVQGVASGGYYGAGGYSHLSGYKKYQLIWCEVCHLLRTRIVTRSCSRYGGCRWSTSWIRSRACTRIKEYRVSAGYRYGEGGYRYGGGYSSLSVHR